MKNVSLLFGLLLLAAVTFAQAPQAFNYQAVARDTTGEVIINQPVSVKISLLIGNPEGTVAYSETHLTTTSNSGIFNLMIGSGTVETGSFAGISWGNDAIFVKIEMDVTGGDDFEFMGTSQLLSVPYSLYSNNGVPDGQNPGDMLFWSGTGWQKIPAGQNGQVLTFYNGVPVWGSTQLPVLNTSAVTNITANTAFCGGNITYDGGFQITERGICWSTSPNPTTIDFIVFAGSGSGSFQAQMTQLEASTLYFVRSFATNSAGTSYGQDMTFYTSNGNITMTTTAVSSITTNSAVSGGNIINNGGSSVIERGVCWNTTPYPTTAHSKTSDGAGNGDYISNLAGLEDNTLYYVRSYATNNTGTSYGNMIIFTTLQNQPPLVPFAPSPENGAQNHYIEVVLSWACTDPEGDPLTFDVYFGNEATPPQIALGQASTTFDPGTLSYNTNYFWKIVAHDIYGNTTEGVVWDFTTKQLEIGDIFGGGKVAYILQPNDPGFVIDEVHGLIAASNDQNYGEWGCLYTDIIGADGTAIGTGYQNTMDIESGCPTPGTAADICANLILNGYSDWFLPSRDELNKLFINKNILSGFGNWYYWSSTEHGSWFAWSQHFYGGNLESSWKYALYNVRAIRYF